MLAFIFKSDRTVHKQYSNSWLLDFDQIHGIHWLTDI